ncbi:MAG: DUF6596 domain-containing protein [Solirubrobacteraceae bacterium]
MCSSALITSLSLFALLLLTAGRRPAHVDGAGEPVLLADQDRTRWNQGMIREGTLLLGDAVRRTGGVAVP